MTSTNLTFDVTLKGWSFANDYEESDQISDACFMAAERLVKWVAAPDMQAVNLFIAKNNLQPVLDSEPHDVGHGISYNQHEDGVDVIIDENGDVVSVKSENWLEEWLQEQANFAREYMAAA